MDVARARDKVASGKKETGENAALESGKRRSEERRKGRERERKERRQMSRQREREREREEHEGDTWVMRRDRMR